MTESNEDLAAEVKRLSGRVDAIMMQRNPPEYQKQLLDNSEQIKRHEYALFGVRGDNGLNSQVRELRAGLAGMHELIQGTRDSVADVKGQLDKIHRWALALIPATLMAGVMVAIAILETHH